MFRGKIGNSRVWMKQDRRRRRSRFRPEVAPLEDRQPLSVTAFDNTFTVASTGNDPTVSGTLPWAVQQADAASGTSLINFDASVFGTTPQRIALTNGYLTISNTATTTIEGPGAGLLTVNGDDAKLVFVRAKNPLAGASCW